MFYTLRTVFNSLLNQPKKDSREIYLQSKGITTHEQLEYWLKEYEKANGLKVW